MMYRYYEPDELTDYTICFTSKRLATYPKVLRFGSFADKELYRKAKESFIQSTKIPASCDKCPINYDCQKKPQGLLCRRTWGRIWEYVR